MLLQDRHLIRQHLYHGYESLSQAERATCDTLTAVHSVHGLREYLAGECVTCHRPGGADGIPVITGWAPENFIHALYEYKQEARNNPVMITVAKRLADEEMAALAAYFSSLDAN